ncbi:hypothetical protein DSO57_1038880 [Entomophthora muscae]|uniref:Uncharacterized protein n=1 Tax=Entomophthora muscae TaxID=34485 RepID=A0ACC2SBP2_9FUNG|nr:hypothetical protein DSO57_1038880 [Entomophthora muscae]
MKSTDRDVYGPLGICRGTIRPVCLRREGFALRQTMQPFKNIPDINQILTREKCWNQVDKCSTGGAKFDREFPPLSGENWNNLTSGQAPATLCQPPATPRKPPASLTPVQRAPAAQPATSHPPAQAGTSGPAASPPPARQPPASLPPACLAPAGHLLAHPSPQRTRCLPPGHPPAPRAPANCQLPTWVPGPTPQPTKTHHDTHPIRKVP